MEIPTPFPGASNWLQQAYASVMRQVDGAATPLPVTVELKIRRQLDGYLNRFRREALRHRRKWEHMAARAKGRVSVEGPTHVEASGMVKMFVELLQTVRPDQNRDEIKRLEAIA